jgi:uncharacterized membrane protein
MLAFLHTKRAALALLVLLIVAGAWTHYFVVPKDDRPVTDIYYDLQEAQRLVAGENPYERILSGDMRTNQKYATYFPLFYLLSAGVVKLGLQEFPQFLAFWQLVLSLFNAGTGVILFYLLWPRRGLLLAVFGVLFWFFSRWNLYATSSGNLDYLAVFFLLLSFWLLPRHRVWAFVALSLSLGFKQLGVILVPLFLIAVWQSERQHRIRAVVVACVALASILVVTSAPFLAASPEAFLKSMIFGAVRDPATHVNAPSLGVLLGLSGAASRLPFFVLAALIYALFWRRKIGLYTAGLLILASFINVNPVLFLQYLVWFTPFFPLAASEVFPGRKTTLVADAVHRIGGATPGCGGHGAPDSGRQPADEYGVPVQAGTRAGPGRVYAGMYDRRAALAILALLVLAGAWMHYFGVPRNADTENDIYYDYLEAQRVAAGENPYERILSGDMRTNQKYATYFPLFYLLSAGVVKVGLQEFPQFLAFWRFAFLLFNAGAGVLLFYLLWPRRGLLLAVFGVLFWFFSRWNLYVTSTANIDYPAVFFLLLSFWLLPRHRVWAFVALSLSLGFKQLDVILVPLFLIAVWQSERQHRIRAVVVACVALASTLVVTSAPFLVANPEAFLKSMMFEVVRDPIAQIYAPSLGVVLGLSGAASRLPFFALVALVYALFWRREIGFYTAGLLTLASFIYANPVLFLQYFVWLTPFFPLAASEAFPGSGTTLAADAEHCIGSAAPGREDCGVPAVA